MKILVDEHIPLMTVQVLPTMGHDVRDIRKLTQHPSLYGSNVHPHLFGGYAMCRPFRCLSFAVVFSLCTGPLGCGSGEGAKPIAKRQPKTVQQKPAPKPAVKNSQTRAIQLVSSLLEYNDLNIRASDLRGKNNPKGQGVFVYVPKTRFRGVERYIAWVVIDGRAYSINGATKNVTPSLPWPREAPDAAWKKTNLDKYAAAEAIGLVFEDGNDEEKLSTRTARNAPRPAPKSTSARAAPPTPQSDPTCGSITGKTRTDLRNVKIFCKQVVPEGGIVVGAYSMRELLWVKVSYEAAKVMQNESLATEQLVKRWMATWKLVCESEVVTIYVEWEDVEIARGQTTAFSGDKVTLRKG